MTIHEITTVLQQRAPLSYQESYDNAGLITGNAGDSCTGILVSLDVTEAVVEEAVKNNCNLIVAHHPIVFKGLKSLTGRNYVERTIISAIQQRVAIYAIHTNLDNVLDGVNGRIAHRIGLISTRVLTPKEQVLSKLVTFCPSKNAGAVRDALFRAGAGAVGNYDECSFNLEGTGTFKAGDTANPFVGKQGERHEESEIRIEVLVPVHLQNQVIAAMKQAHPYEEVAYYLQPLTNTRPDVGSGLIGELKEEMEEVELLNLLKKQFFLKVIRHTPLIGKKIKKVALCGGSGVFLLKSAMAAGADVFITGDVKYHEFFDADEKILLADIGHFESEQFTVELLAEILQQKFPNFAVRKSETNTNPVNYFI